MTTTVNLKQMIDDLRHAVDGRLEELDSQRREIDREEKELLRLTGREAKREVSDPGRVSWLVALKKMPAEFTPRDLAALVGLRPDQASNALTRHKKLGRVERVRSGVWRVLP